MKSRLNVCVVTSTYPRHEEDYAVPWMRESHRRLAERGHKITILAPSYMGLEDHEIDGLPVRRFRYAPKKMERLTHEEGAPNKIQNPLFQALAVPYVASGVLEAARLARGGQFDLVHVHWPFPHEAIGSTLSRVANVPMVQNCHGVEFALARRKPWVAQFLRRSLRRGELVIANSSDTASKIHDLSGREAAVLPYGSTVSAKSRPKPQNGVPRLLFTGRLIPRKGVQYLLRAMPLILAQRKVELVITGSGDQREPLEALARELNLGDSVKFLGFVSNGELDRQYHECDVWINPSIVDDRGDTEGLGVGAIEAYAHGKPVVASAVGGIPDAVRHRETGFLVPQRDEHALASAILELVDNPEMAAQFGRNGLYFAQLLFGWDRITDELVRHYHNSILKREAANTKPRPRSTGPVLANT